MKYGASFLCILLALPISAAAQPSKISLDRIMNPLRDFEPFEKPVATVRYFPDGIERRVRPAIIAALIQRPDKLREHLSYAEGEDEKRAAEGNKPSGLTPLLRELYRNSVPDHRNSSPGLPASTPTNLQQAEALLAGNDVNQWSRLLNRLLGATDLVQLASGSYITAAFETAFVEIQRTRALHMPEAERKALVLYKRFLKRFPKDPQNTEVLARAATLEAKKKDVWVHRQLEEARKSLHKGNIDEAEFHTSLAAAVYPKAGDVKQQFREIAKAQEARTKNHHLHLSVKNTDNLADLPPEQRPDIQALLYALVKGNSETAGKQAREMAQRYEGKPLGTLAKSSQAVALDLGGRHEEAKRALEEIARTAPFQRERHRAQGLLDSPEYNLLGALDRARTDYKMDQVRFVLLGENFLEKNVLIGASPMIAHGIGGAATLGTANILMLSSNLLEFLGGNPVSNQTVINAAAQYIRSRPSSEKSGDVYLVLGETYERKGQLHRALHYYRLSGKLTPERIHELEESSGQTLLNAAKGTTSKAQQQALYAVILQHYPETSAAESAKIQLAQLVSVENRGLRLSKEFLAENPRLYSPEGLGLKTELFDGNIHNMELADQGLNILGHNALLLHYDTPWGTRTRTHSASRERIENLKTLLRDKHYKLAKLDIDGNFGSGPGDIENFPSKLMRLERQEARPDAADLQFIRRAGHRADPRSTILDHALLSKKEINPQRAYGIPSVQGSVTTSGVNMRADVPESFLANELMIGNDTVSPYAGVRLPIPFLKDFIPVDFMLRARPGLPSLTPQIRRPETSVDDAHLYR